MIDTIQTEKIILRETQNDLAHIHIYRNTYTGLWYAFGYSAYGLRLFCKAEGYANLRTYSAKLQMPCAVVTQSALPALTRYAAEVLAQDEEALTLRLADKVDATAYAKWADRLRGECKADEDLSYIPRFSVSVSKEGYIKDNMSDVGRNMKRIFDCLLAAVLLVVFSPLFLVCYIAVRFEDGGKAIFSQERIGRFGRPFHIYKFRSMRLDAEKAGPQLSHAGGDNDSRLTRAGRFLRKHHLDELPQLWNVFVGDMAFVGPRPERKFYIEQIMERDRRYAYLYQIRPGVTSYATLYNGYTDTMEKMLRRLEYDLYYLSHRSLWLDVKILALTFLRIVGGKKF